PHFAEAPAGRYVSPEEFYAILSYFADPTKRAFVELLYLLGIRPGQLKGTEISNVRIEKGKPVALVYRPDQVKQRTPHESHWSESDAPRSLFTDCGGLGSWAASSSSTSTANR